jgi:integrase
MNNDEYFIAMREKGGQKVDKFGGKNMSKWKTAGPGIRYREHPTRKHGIKPDRYYAIHYRIDGKRIEEALGWLSQGWTQEKCEATRNDLKQSAKNSGPKTLKARRAIAELAAKAVPKFSDVLEEFWDIELQDKKSGKEQKRLITKDALPVWGERKLVDITRRDAVLLVDGVRDRGLVVANRLQGALVKMFNFAVERGVLENSPLVGMRKKQEQPRSRTLSDDEIKIFWDAFDLENTKIDIYRVSKLALKMILLTGQRPGEVCGMTWKEIDSEEFWNIPAERRKGKTPQRVPLTGLALDVIEQARMYSEDSPYVFTSSHKINEPMTPHALSKGIVRHWKEMGIAEKFTPHDLRRTVRTKLAEIGIDDVVAECVLGHKIKGIQGVYNRHSYDAEKRQALEKWEKKLRRIVGIDELETSGKIIELRKLRYGGK